MIDKLYTIGEVALKCRVSAETVRRWIRDDKLRGLTLGQSGAYRVPETALMDFLGMEAPEPPRELSEIELREKQIAFALAQAEKFKKIYKGRGRA